MVSSVLQAVTFEVKRFAPNATSLKDVQIFIEAHKDDKDRIEISIDPTGIGECFADYLEYAGFSVKRVRHLQAVADAKLLASTQERLDDIRRRAKDAYDEKTGYAFTKRPSWNDVNFLLSYMERANAL
jgi:hypothetical protein